MKFSAERLKALIPRGSAKNIAALAGVSAPALSQWASGERDPGAIELAKVAKALCVSLDYFFPDLHPQSPQAFRESTDANIVDDLMAEVVELKERVFAVERIAKKMKQPVFRAPTKHDLHRTFGEPYNLKRSSEAQAAAKKASSSSKSDPSE